MCVYVCTAPWLWLLCRNLVQWVGVAAEQGEWSSGPEGAVAAAASNVIKSGILRGMQVH